MPVRNRTLLITVGTLSLVILLAVNVIYRIAFDDLRQSLDANLGEQLVGLADALAGGIQSESANMIVGESFDPDTYLRVHDLMEAFRSGNRLVSVSILDTLWNDPFADRPDSLNQLVYSLLDREGRWALMSGLSWVSPTYQWGDTFYRSAASPILDSAGNTVAIVRLEVDAGYFGPLSGLERLAWWIHGSSALLAAGLLLLFVWYTRRARRWETRLMHSEKLIGLGRLAATIAHEIRNPLAIIKATAQRLNRIDDPEKKRELVRFIPEEADRLNRILTRYLQIASPEETPAVPVQMEAALSRWMEASFPHDDGSHSRWELRIQTSGPIMANPDAPHQVLLNLINNALDVSPADEPVLVEWQPSGHHWGRLTVADRGPGIPARLKERVFEPFYTTKTKGSGLGLYAVRMMVERDGGRVRIEDNAGGGAVFIVEWPLAQGEEHSGTDMV